MPRKVDRLSAVAVRSAACGQKPYKLFDGGGLFLLVEPAGKYWRLAYSFSGKRKLLSVGVWPAVGLAAARQTRDEARRLLAQGVDPGAHRKAEKQARRQLQADSFEALAREWWEQVHRRSVVASHADRNLRRFEKHLFPAIGHLPVAEVTAPLLLVPLREVAATGRTETAHRLRALAGQVLRYAVATARAERDVAADLRDALPPAPDKHHAAILDPETLGGLLRAVEGYGGEPATRAALKLLPMLFVRPGELRTARWEDFDLEVGAWDYRPSKGGLPFISPLPRQAVAVLRELHALTGPEGYVFPANRGKGRPLSENTVNAALAYMGFKGAMTGHGFRATARTLLVERLGFNVEWVEMQLGHAVKDATGRAYNRTTFLPQRREMLEAWTGYLDRLRLGLEVVEARMEATHG